MITRERYQYYLMFDYLSRMVNSIQTTEFVICLDLPFFVNCALTPIRECDNGKKIQLIFVFFLVVNHEISFEITKQMKLNK